MATSTAKVEAPAPSSSVDAMSVLQSAFNARMTQADIEKLAKELNVTVNVDELKAAIAFRDSPQGGLGSRFQTAPTTPTPAPEAPSLLTNPNEAAIARSQSALEAARSIINEEPSLGLDPQNRAVLEQMGPVGRYLLAPIGDIGAGLATGIQAGLYGAATGIGEGLNQLGALDALTKLTSVKETPRRFAEQALNIADVTGMNFPFGLRAGLPEVAPVTVPRAAALDPLANLPAAPRIAEVAAEITPPPTPRIPTPKAAPKVELPSAVIPKQAEAATFPPTAQLKAEGPEAVAAFEEVGATQPVLDLPTHKRVSNFQADVGAELANMGITRATERGGKPYPFQDFIADNLHAGTLPNEVLAGLIQKHGLFHENDIRTALGASMESATEAARILNVNSQAARTVLRIVADNPELGIALDKANRAANALNSIGSLLRWVGRTRAGALTGTIGTAARNAWAASPIMPTYSFITELADAGIRSARNVGRARAGEDLLMGPTATDALYNYVDELSRGVQLAAQGLTRGAIGITKKQRRTNDILSAISESFPTQYEDLYSTFSSDLSKQYRDPTKVTSKIADKVDRFIEFANVPNTLVSRWSKNAQFPAILRMEAKRRGIDLDAMFDAGTIKELDPQIVEDAARLMQKRLFDERPSGKLGKAFVTLMENVTQPVGLTPFPNFAVSYFKYVAEQNPLAVVRFANKAERAKVLAGDHRAITKIMTGLATTLAYYMTSGDEGEWYEVKDPSTGKLIDARSILGPHMPAMFAAHVIRKAEQNDLGSVRADDVAKLLGASNLRAGVGSYAVDSLVSDLAGADKSESGIQKALGNWTKEYVPGFLRFFGQFKDVSGQFVSDEDTKMRSPETTGQAIMAQLPGGANLYQAITGENIPERQVITREATPRTVNPLLRTLVGVTVPEDRNFLEETIGRSGLRTSDLFRKTGVADFDKLMQERLGQAADQYILPDMLQNKDKVSALSGAELRLAIRDAYERNRAAIRKEIYTEDPRLQLMIKFDSMSEDERKLANERAMRENGKSVTDMFRESEGKPMVWTDSDVAALPRGTEYMDVRDYKLKVKR